VIDARGRRSQGRLRLRSGDLLRHVHENICFARHSAGVLLLRGAAASMIILGRESVVQGTLRRRNEEDTLRRVLDDHDDHVNPN
jgi:hypothetical protein